MGSEYLQSHPTIAVLALLAMLLGTLLVIQAPRLNRIFARHHRLFVIIGFLILRVGLLVILVFVLRHPAGPDKDTWALHGKCALEGLLPYVDYHSEYCPLFSYLLAPAFLVLSEFVAPVVVFIIFDFLVLMSLYHATNSLETNRLAAVIYLVSPISWYMVVRYGQDESIGALFVILIYILMRKRSEVAAGFIAALAIAVTKLLFLLVAFPMILTAKRRLWLSIMVAGLIAGCYMPLLIRGANPFQWISSTPKWGGPGLWQALGLPARTHWGTACAVCVVVVLVLVGILIFKGRRIGTVNSAILLFSGVMIVSPKAWTPYALLILPLLCIRMAVSKKRYDLLLFSSYGFAVVFYPFILPAIHQEALTSLYILGRLTVLSVVSYHFYLLVTVLLGLVSPKRRSAWESDGVT